MKKALFLPIIIVSYQNGNNTASVLSYKIVYNYFVRNNRKIPDFGKKVINTKNELNRTFDGVAFNNQVENQYK
ncbi:hypothetical protein ACP3T3_09490 [Chryseobacterium sp. CBSDS_008]|uniref:hypothetical protein n=1 Tax=Chryseobacterium sp. CBSDS_008 TaxID=3415265 RepID=UPI003CEC499F